MMLYKISIEEVLEPADGSKYPSHREIYAQEIVNLDIPKVVSYLNNPNQSTNLKN